MRFEVERRPGPLAQAAPPVLRGPCWVVDGDTIIIDKVHIRLAGIDAPELDHPWGQQAKWALVKLCKGQVVTARLKPELSYDRVVAECFLPDGRDLAAELVQAGLALDWPKFSGGKYRHLEPEDARRKLWRANLRQRGVSFVEETPVTPATPPPPPQASRPPVPYAAPRPVASRQVGRRIRWWLSAGFVVVLVVGLLLASNAGRPAPLHVARQAPSAATFVVEARVLNVRKEPRAASPVVGQVTRGTAVAPVQASGAWYGIVLDDGGAGWVHSDYLRQVD